MKCTCIITSDDFIVRIGTIKLQPCKPHISGSLFFFSSAACVVLRHCSPRRIFLGYCLFLQPAQTPMRGVGKIRGIGKLVHTPPVPKRRQHVSRRNCLIWFDRNYFHYYHTESAVHDVVKPYNNLLPQRDGSFFFYHRISNKCTVQRAYSREQSSVID